MRNTFRRKGRVVLTEITLILAGVVFVMVRVPPRRSRTRSIISPISLGLKVLINFQQPLRSDEVTAVIAAQPNIDKVEMQLFQTSTAFKDKEAEKGEDIFINAVRPESTLLKLPVVAGRWLLPDDEHAVVLEPRSSRQTGCDDRRQSLDQPGRQHAPKRNGPSSARYSISAICSARVYVPLPVYQREVGLVGRSTSAWLSTHARRRRDPTAASRSQLRDTLECARSARRQHYRRRKQIRAENENNFGIITTMLLTMSALIAAVGAIGLAGTLSINVLERRREIGVMRAIGASSLTIAGIFIGEGLLLGLIAWVIAIPLSMPVGQVFATVIGQVIQVRRHLSVLVEWRAAVADHHRRAVDPGQRRARHPRHARQCARKSGLRMS